MALGSGAVCRVRIGALGLVLSVLCRLRQLERLICTRADGTVSWCEGEAQVCGSKWWWIC
jgi:hypothetical protein